MSRLPVPGKVDPKGLSLHAVMEAGMLLRMNDEEARRWFTPSEVLLYQHAQDYRYILQVYLIIYCLSIVYV